VLQDLRPDRSAAQRPALASHLSAQETLGQVGKSSGSRLGFGGADRVDGEQAHGLCRPLPRQNLHRLVTGGQGLWLTVDQNANRIGLAQHYISLVAQRAADANHQPVYQAH